MTVRKAVIPAAGLGTRFLPATKAQPKEMVTVVDRPSIQYVVEEAARAGIEDILIISSRGKGALEDHFDRAPELEEALERKGDDDKLRSVREVGRGVQVHFVRQPAPLGLGHAVLQAERHIGDEAFAVLLPDDLVVRRGSLLAELIACHERHGASVITGMDVGPVVISSKGAISAAPEPLDDGSLRVLDLIEKPDPGEAPSTLAIVGRYVFTPAVFDALHKVEPGRGGEIQLTDALRALAHDDPGSVLAIASGGEWLDVGNKPDYLRATVELGARHPELGPAFVEFLRKFVAGLDDGGSGDLDVG